MKRLPTGVQTFSKIIEGNCYYVDKTEFIKKLEDGWFYFLSRPRRFGKSLFLDTIKEAYSGNRELFKGLYLYDNWDWDKRYPVIKISFGAGTHGTSNKLIQKIFFQLKLNQRTLGLECEEKEDYSNCLYELIIKASEKYNERVVVLVDEYDKPILDAIENIEVAKENREILKDFYSVLKEADPYIKLAFLTGVSRFSKVSIFSGLNQLNDITIDSDFATVCGYTQSELETVFADRLEGVDLEALKKWYNGYSWLGDKVYNPFDVLLFFNKKDFRSYWFESGTPTFLVKLILGNKFCLPKLESLRASNDILANLDIDFIKIENILFQSGYLTIKEVNKLGERIFYTLTYPNLEVRISFNNFFLDDILPSVSVKEEAESGLIEAIEQNDLDRLKDILYTFFASIPHDWYRKNNLEDYEGFYASVVYALFNGAGLEAKAEDTTNKGRIDLTIIYQDRVYIIEFKVVEDEPENKALSQIKEKKYYEKYGAFKKIYLIGIEFSKREKNIVGFEWEIYKPSIS